MAVVDVANDIAATQASRDRKPTGPPQASKTDPLASEVVERWKRASEEVMRQRRDYWQNLSFFYGEQWVWWDRRRGNLQTFPTEWSPLGKGRARTVTNRIASNLIGLLGRLLRNNLEFDVPPTDAADDVVAGALLAQDVLNAQYADLGWRAVRYGENFSKFMGGTAAVALEWDTAAGVPLTVDERSSAIVGTGEVELTSLAITEFVLEPGVRDDRKARWWIQGLALNPDQVKEHYKLSWTPQADVSAMLSPLQQRLLEHLGKGQGGNRLCLVLSMYEKPNDDVRDGRYVVVVNNTVVHKGPWPFPDKDRLNLFVFHQQSVDGTWIGRTLLNDAVPIQMQYNFIRSVVAEHAKKVGNARIAAPIGSFDETDVTDDPGSILWYMPDVSGSAPGYMTPPELSRWLTNEDTKLKAELDDIMFTHSTSRGEASFDRASGQALALLAEKDDSPLGLMAFEEADTWGQIGSYVLELYETKVVETRKARVDPRVGTVGQVRTSRWNGQSLQGQTRAYVPLESTLPSSQAAMHAFVSDLWDKGIMKDPVQFARMARLPQRELVEVVDADVAKAQRENARMMEGRALEPETFDNHGTHISEHNRFRKSDSYQFADGTIRGIVDLHVLYHEKLAAEEAGKQMMKAGLNPALAQLPQADEPPGSLVPPDFAKMQAGLGGPPPGAAAGNLPAGFGEAQLPPEEMAPPPPPGGEPMGAPPPPSVGMAAGAGVPPGGPQ